VRLVWAFRDTFATVSPFFLIRFDQPKPSRPASKATTVRLTVFRQRRRRCSNSCWSAGRFFRGWRSTPGPTPAANRPTNSTVQSRSPRLTSRQRRDVLILRQEVASDHAMLARNERQSQILENRKYLSITSAPSSQLSCSRKIFCILPSALLISRSCTRSSKPRILASSTLEISAFTPRRW
jgi:hypothetical protein